MFFHIYMYKQNNHSLHYHDNIFVDQQSSVVFFFTTLYNKFFIQ